MACTFFLPSTIHTPVVGYVPTPITRATSAYVCTDTYLLVHRGGGAFSGGGRHGAGVRHWLTGWLAALGCLVVVVGISAGGVE